MAMSSGIRPRRVRPIATAVAHMFRDLAHGRGMTILMICHDLSIASPFSDRIVLLNEGRVFADGTPEEVLTESNIGMVYGIGCEVVAFEGRPHLVFRDGGTDHGSWRYVHERVS